MDALDIKILGFQLEEQDGYNNHTNDNLYWRKIITILAFIRQREKERKGGLEEKKKSKQKKKKKDIVLKSWERGRGKWKK